MRRKPLHSPAHLPHVAIKRIAEDGTRLPIDVERGHEGGVKSCGPRSGGA